MKMLLRDTYTRRDYKGLAMRLMDYSKTRNGEIAELTADAAEAIEELEDEVADWKAYGKWIPTEEREEMYGTMEECSVCRELSIEHGNFCPNCGALMEGE